MSAARRVLHIHSGNMFGGIETILVTVARYRAVDPQLDHQFALCFDDRLAAELRRHGVPVHLIGAARASRPWSVLAARKRLEEVMATERPDVLLCHAPWVLALFGKTLGRAGLPLAFWLHGAATGKHWSERRAKHTAPSGYLCNSDFTASTLKLLYPRATGEVVYPPVPPLEIPDRNASRREVRARLETPHGAVVIIQVGRLELGKGFDILLYGLEAVAQDLPWVAWLVGGATTPTERKHEAELRRLAEGLGIANRVRFLGQRSDIAELLAGADVYVQPNTRPEGFGISLVEALYAGLPVVTSGLGGALEIVTDRCGVLVPPGWPERLSEALTELIKDETLRNRLGTAGPPRARELCAPAQQIGKLGEMLRSIGGG
jgi:glycosyltransferase involved in cell wall biosynthesis